MIASEITEFISRNLIELLLSLFGEKKIMEWTQLVENSAAMFVNDGNPYEFYECKK